MPKKMLWWETGGVAAVIAAGTLLHFAFDWSGRWGPAALFAAVNESLWEHLKIGFWPLLFYSLVEYRFMQGNENFLAAKTAALLIQPLLIVTLYLGYTRFLGRDLMAINIAIFILAAVVAQAVSYFILTAPPWGGIFNLPAALVLLLLISAFSLFTFFPPRLPWLFRDPRNGGYGLSSREAFNLPGPVQKE